MDQTHVESLRRTYGGPMTEEQIVLLRDMEAFIEFCIENGLGFHAAVGTLAHDVNGILTHQDAAWFQPKVSGYARIRRQLREDVESMAADAASDDSKGSES